MSEPMYDPKTGLPLGKSVFVVYFQSAGKSSSRYQRLLKVCQAFCSSLHQWPEDSAVAEKRYNVLTQVLKDKDAALVGFQGYMLDEANDMLAPPRPGSKLSV